MTNPDIPATAPTTRPLLGQVLFYVGFCLALGAFGAGLLAWFERGFDIASLAAIGGLVLTGAAITVYAVHIGDFDPPGIATDTGRSQLILLVVTATGFTRASTASEITQGAADHGDAGR